MISNTEKAFDIKEKHDNNNVNNIATFNGERLEEKFASKNVITISRPNLYGAEISLQISLRKDQSTR